MSTQAKPVATPLTQHFGMVNEGSAPSRFTGAETLHFQTGYLCRLDDPEATPLERSTGGGDSPGEATETLEKNLRSRAEHWEKKFDLDHLYEEFAQAVHAALEARRSPAVDGHVEVLRGKLNALRSRIEEDEAAYRRAVGSM
jgi:hypothetical protein